MTRRRRKSDVQAAGSIQSSIDRSVRPAVDVLVPFNPHGCRSTNFLAL